MHQQINLIDSDAKARALICRQFMSYDYHVEVFENVDELKAFMPQTGIVMARDEPGNILRIIELFEATNVWHPVVAFGSDTNSHRIVDLAHLGVVDFFTYPLDVDFFVTRMSELRPKLAKMNAEMKAKAEAKALISSLSSRETEVLNALAHGNSNKNIAQLLNISPRTVEIHRANMMGKLGATHTAEAVTVALASGITTSFHQRSEQANQAEKIRSAA